MDTQTSMMIFQTTCFLGFALWLSIALINNLHGFASSVKAVGATLSMAPLRQPPVVDIPLLSRALVSPTLHRLALAVIVVLQLVAVLAVWLGCYLLLLGGGLEAARPWLNLAPSMTLASLFAMLLGGLWFAYWIRQEGLQLTHLMLVIWVLLNFLVLNLRWS